MIMILKLLTVAVIASLCVAEQHLQYPASGLPCILIDIETNNTLSWTDKDGKTTTTPPWSFNGSEVYAGACTPTAPSLSVIWQVIDATFTFGFKNMLNKVNINLTLSFVPDRVFNNSKMGQVSLKNSMMAGTVGKAFKCGEMKPIMFSATTSDGDKYDMTFKIMKIKIQGFGVVSGNYTDVEDCVAAATTSTKLTTTPTSKPTTPTSKPTTPTSKPTNATTKPTNGTTATTKPTNGTTATTKPTNGTTATTKPTNGTTATTKPTNGTTATTKPTNATTATTKPTNATTATTKPTTATTKPTVPSTTPATPDSHPELTLQVFDNKTNCIMLKGQIAFKLMYPALNGNVTSNTSATVGVHSVVNIGGNCHAPNNTNILTLTFLKGWTMDITFATDGAAVGFGDGTSNYWWKSVDLTYVYAKDVFPKDLDPAFVGKMSTVSAELGKGTFGASTAGSYICNADTSTNVGNATMETWNLQYNAFQTSANQTSFGTDHVSECSADTKTNSIVPIAVGAALAGLVVIVLIAYLIGRRRNRKGYESV